MVKPPGVERQRDRVLTDDEIRRVSGESSSSIMTSCLALIYPKVPVESDAGSL
jgi:hypothetical protein